MNKQTDAKSKRIKRASAKEVKQKNDEDFNSDNSSLASSSEEDILVENVETPTPLPNKQNNQTQIEE